jgi:glycosyltransferase involved in cell wall biosynthesis
MNSIRGTVRAKNPFFSVIINNYNYGRYIEEAIESVLNQTFPQNDLEIIVVDDGSTDDTSEKVKKYKDRIRYIAKKNGGQASALNVGIENAQGTIIAFLDSDDYWHPMKLQSVAEEFKKNDHMDFVYHYMNVIDEEYKIIDGYIFPEPIPGKKTGLRDSYLDLYLRGKLPWFSPTSGMTVRADCLKRVTPVPEEFRIGADLYLHYILPFYMRELSLIKKPLGYYRMHGDNLSGGNILTAGKIQREIHILMRIHECIEEEAGKFGYDSHLIRKRLEASIMAYRILFECLKHEKVRALKNILFYNSFLPGDSIFYRISRKLALLTYVFFPPSLCLWLQRRYRRVLSLFRRVSQRRAERYD